MTDWLLKMRLEDDRYCNGCNVNCSLRLVTRGGGKDKHIRPDNCPLFKDEKKDCENCKHTKNKKYEIPCIRCGDYDKWEPET